MRLYLSTDASQPFNLKLSSNCSDFTTELSWTISSSIVTSFRVEYSSEFAPRTFFPLTTVNGSSVRHVRLTELSPWANLSFRVSAVNELGTSLPSDSTPSRLCQTPEAGELHLT